MPQRNMEALLLCHTPEPETAIALAGRLCYSDSDILSLKDAVQGNVLFLFDEPTTGLHFHDINKLLAAFDALIRKGHTIVVVEHNMDVIKCADWVIDLGPEAGDRGGRVVFEGTPAQLETCAESYTGQFLKLRTKL